MRDLELFCIVAFNGKMVSSSYGLSEPESSDLRAILRIDSGFLVVYIVVWQPIVHYQ
jgi:hypothetical protein